VPDPGVSFASIRAGGDERFVSLRRQLGVTSFGMNLIALAPGERGRIHRHERQEEVYVVLEGELTLALGPDDERVLAQGEVARVAPDVRRQLINGSEQPLLLLALGGSGEHEGRDGRAWAAWDEPGDGRSPQEVPLPEDRPR
jgi:uncharacterized cupin superfamily protein